MTRDKAKTLIQETVTNLRGCRRMELIAHDSMGPVIREFDIDIIDEMVSAGELVEIEYVLPTMNYRVKSFLLPAGTEVRKVSSQVN